MPVRTRLLLAATVGIIGGSTVAHLAFAVYLRSPWHRRAVEARLTDYFDLPCEVGRIERRTFAATAFDDVNLWLPDRRDRVFHCEQAFWDASDPASVVLRLSRGHLALGADTWTLDDYRQLLASGFRHDFDVLRRIELARFDFSFRRKEVMLSLADAHGTVLFDSPDLGIGSLQAFTLNGFRAREPVRVHARIRPKGKTLVEEMALEVPEVPLAGLGLDKPLAAAVSRGRFSGRLLVRDGDGAPRLTVSGRIFDVDLSELTQRLPFGPLHGAAELVLDRADMHGPLPTLVQGRAAVTGVPLSDFAGLFDVPSLSGTASLNISEADISNGHIHKLVINGRLDRVELRHLTSRFGKGEVTGVLSVVVNSLRVEDDRIASADVDVVAQPPDGGVGTIDRDLLLSIGKQLAGFALPAAIPRSLVPQPIEYTRFGLRLLVSDNQLRVLGTHGANNDSILTVRLLGTEWGVLRQWSGTIDLTPWVELIRQRATEYDPSELRDILQRPH